MTSDQTLGDELDLRGGGEAHMARTEQDRGPLTYGRARLDRVRVGHERHRQVLLAVADAPVLVTSSGPMAVRSLRVDFTEGDPLLWVVLLGDRCDRDGVLVGGQHGVRFDEDWPDWVDVLITEYAPPWYATSPRPGAALGSASVISVTEDRSWRTGWATARVRGADQLVGDTAHGTASGPVRARRAEVSWDDRAPTAPGIDLRVYPLNSRGRVQLSASRSSMWLDWASAPEWVRRFAVDTAPEWAALGERLRSERS